MPRLPCFVLIALGFVGNLGARADEPAPLRWILNDTATVGGQAATVLGSPRVIRDATGVAATAFDGVRDGLVLPINPIAGWQTFTIELLFRPDADGPREQRFFHIQDQVGSRVLLETRVTPGGQWILDAFLFRHGQGLPLIDRNKLHACGEWHWVSVRYDGRRLTSFVNGVPQAEAETEFTPLKSGQTSLGVRLNRVYWFKGAIREIRLTPSALPDEKIAR